MKNFLIKVNGVEYKVEVEEIKKETVAAPKQEPRPEVKAVQPPPNPVASQVAVAPGSGSAVSAPMPGTVLKLNVAKGDTIAKGQTLLILEAMKMENEIISPTSGKVADVRVQKGQQVNAGDVMIVVEG